jgi:hypothetical protein
MGDERMNIFLLFFFARNCASGQTGAAVKAERSEPFFGKP